MRGCRTTVSRAGVAIALTIGCGLTAGCARRAPHAEKPRADVTVAITYDGEPVTAGRVDLNDEQTGLGGGAELDDSGTATISRIVQGTYTVTVKPPMPDPEALAPGEPPPEPAEFPEIPERYRRIDTSPLEMTVEGERRRFSFDLKQE